MLRSGFVRSFETGLAAYNVGAALAAHQLRVGFSVIAEAANFLTWRSGGRSGGRRAKPPMRRCTASRSCAATSQCTGPDWPPAAAISHRSRSRLGSRWLSGGARPSRGFGHASSWTACGRSRRASASCSPTSVDDLRDTCRRSARGGSRPKRLSVAAVHDGDRQLAQASHCHHVDVDVGGLRKRLVEQRTVVDRVS